MDQLGPRPDKPDSDALGSSHTILVGAHDSASSFLHLFEEIRKTRKAKGTPTDQEQDLLRAMLVFASAGLDSMLKQLVRDSLELVIERSEGAQLQFKSFVEKRLLRQGSLDPKFLSEVLVETNPRDMLMEYLIEDLTSRSLQSKEQIFRTASYFDLPSKNLTADATQLEKIFAARNEMSHEMDVDLAQRNRNRRPRRKKQMIEYTSIILQLADNILEEVDKKLAQRA